MAVTSSNAQPAKRADIAVSAPCPSFTRRGAHFISGINCQRADWPTHKRECNKGEKWYDCHRLCQDGSEHFGDLELITWKCPTDGTGWGNVFVEEEEHMKKKFTEEFGGDLKKLFDNWPQAFRWRCCGMDGSMTWGCDHHGSGTKPCTCDFCK